MNKPRSIKKKNVTFSLQFGDDPSKWQDGKLKLRQSCLVVVDKSGKKTKLKFSLSTRASIVMQEGSPKISFESENEVLLRFDAFRTKEAQKWVKMINYYVKKIIVQHKHKHPLTFFEICPKSCSSCQKDIVNRLDQRGWICEFCAEDYVLCQYCYEQADFIYKSGFASVHHQHTLFPFKERPQKTWHQADLTCQKCHEQLNDNDRANHCLICEDYVECVKCSAPPLPDETQCGAHTCLDVENFVDIINVDPQDQHYSLKEGALCPAAMSLITSGYWDLRNIASKPATDAYFEVSFLSFNSDAVIGLGIGNQIFTPNALLGHQQNSIGYLNSGIVSLNSSESHVATCPEIHQGDTIGCGALYDSYCTRKLFFTHNGKLLDARVFLHDGMDCFPGVTFSRNSNVQFRMNIKGPFKFDLVTVPDHRLFKMNYFEAMPYEVNEAILSYLITLPIAAFNQLPKVCKAWREWSSENSIWREKFCLRWPNQNLRLNIKSWKKFYKSRHLAAYERIPLPSHHIENCEFEFKCPLLWEHLKTTATNERERFCDKCAKTVYAVSDVATLKSYSQMGRCVSLVANVVRTLEQELYAATSLMGRIAFPINYDDEEPDEWSDWE